MNTQLRLEYDLSSFDLETRSHALQELILMLDHGQVSIVPELPIVNLHCYPFFRIIPIIIRLLHVPGKPRREGFMQVE